MRTQPNIIITGTPGVGKTTHCEQLADRTGLKHLSINQVVKDSECHEGWDKEMGCWIVDEDKVFSFSTYSWTVKRVQVREAMNYKIERLTLESK